MGTKGNYVAIRPLSTRLFSDSQTQIRMYESGKGLTHAVPRAFTGVDPEVWARQFLQAVDDFLHSFLPADASGQEGKGGLSCLPGLHVCVERVARAKASLAASIADGIDAVFEGTVESTELKRIRERLQETLLRSLSTGYATDSIFDIYSRGKSVPGMSAGGVSRMDIPVPLRLYPASPALLAQSCTQATESPSDARQARQWYFEFTFESPCEEQDTIYVTIDFDRVANSAQEPEATCRSLLFQNLAQFTYVYANVRSDLFGSLNPRSPDLRVAQAALDTFADIAEAVAGSWAGHRYQMNSCAGPVDDVPAPHRYRCRLERRFKEEGATRELEAITLRVIEDTSDFAAPWPSLFVAASDGEYREMTRGPAAGNACVFTCDASWPRSDGSRIRFRMEGLDVFQAPMVTAGVSVRRNEHLGFESPVRKEFVYETPTVMFSEPCRPYIHQASPMVIDRPGSDLATALALFFAELFEEAVTPSLVKLSVAYVFEIADGKGSDPETGKLVASLPVLMMPPTAYRHDLGEQLVQHVRKWRSENAAGRRGHFEMTVSIFSSSEIPLLTLEGITFSPEER